MTEAKTSENVSPELLKVAERAKRNPTQKILALAQYIDVPVLARAFRRMRKDAAVGVDGVTVEQYGQNLEENLRALHERLKAGKYRHQPIRRVNIPKENGKTRPIGVSTVEDKIVQGALKDVVEAIYEQDFLDCSYGFRPGRRPHDAIRAIDQGMVRGSTKYILEADIVSYFDSIDRAKLMEMLRERIADESLMRLVGKCLHVGVLDGEEYSEPEEGTTQGSALSPILGNIYLHHVLDLWMKRTVEPLLRGSSKLVRYADDFVIGFERRDDAERVMKALVGRMAKYGLTLHPDKTRLLEFRPPENGGGNKGTANFDFLGFTAYWRRTWKGKWSVTFKTRRARLRRAIKAAADWCRSHRHFPVQEQHATLVRKLEGHYNYFGVNGNIASLKKLKAQVEASWQKWLDRRSQRAHMTWERFKRLLAVMPLPAPHITVQIWARP
jgi:group II intron reverse transcriptase/maturase